MDFEIGNRNCLWIFVASALGVLFFILSFGLTPLNPQETDWLLNRNDPAFHLLGFQYYQQDAWRWPPGEMQNYYAPIGASIALTDSIPLVAMLFKVVAPILGIPFQYFGWWLCLSYALQAAFGFLLTSTLTQDRRISFAGACLFLLAPVFIIRGHHIALASHWLILAALFMNLRSDEVKTSRRFLQWFVLITLSAGTHAYLCFMVWALFFADMLGRAFVGKKRDFLLQGLRLFFMAVWTVFFWYCCGFFVGRFGGMGNPPLGLYSLNLNALINSGGYSFFVPALPWFGSSQSFESFAYLGSGVIALGVLSVICGLPKISGISLNKRFWPLAMVLVGMSVFAISNSVTLNQHEILRIPLPKFFQGALGIVYCSSRFIWPFYYLLTALIIANITRIFRWNWLALCVAALCIVSQYVEQYPFANKRDQMLKTTPEWKERAMQLDPLLEHFSQVATVPRSTRELSKGWDYAGVAYRESFQIKPYFMGGNIARKPYRRLNELDKNLKTALLNGDFDKETLFVCRAQDFYELFPKISDRFYGGFLGGYFLVFSRESLASPAFEIKLSKAQTSSCFKALMQGSKIVVSGANNEWLQKDPFLKEQLPSLSRYEQVETIQRHGLNAGPKKECLAIANFDKEGRIEKVAVFEASGASWVFDFSASTIDE